MSNYSYKYPKLNDKNWLYQKYVIEKCSTIKIANLAGAKTANSAKQALVRASIPVRTISDGLTCNRENDGFMVDNSVIIGCLLGDAGLRSHNPKSDNSYPYFYKRNKFFDHVCFVAKLLFEKDGEQKVKESQEYSTGKYHTIFSVRSLSYKSLMPLFREWYPVLNNYKKVIPDNIELDATMLLHWFLDDGNSYVRKRKTKQVCIVLCSESFSRIDQELMSEKIWDKFGIKCSVRKCQSGTGYRIFVRQKYAGLFYDIIGPPVVSSLAYKWK